MNALTPTLFKGKFNLSDKMWEDLLSGAYTFYDFWVPILAANTTKPQKSILFKPPTASKRKAWRVGSSEWEQTKQVRKWCEALHVIRSYLCCLLMELFQMCSQSDCLLKRCLLVGYLIDVCLFHVLGCIWTQVHALQFPFWVSIVMKLSWQ